MASVDSFGQAFASSAVTTGIATGLSLGLSGLLSAIAVATPVGWAAVGVAVGISVVTAAIYNFDVGGIKSFAEDAGDKIDSGIKWAGNIVSDMWNSVASGS